MNKVIGIIALILVIVGALNWGLVGAFDFNLVSYVLGTGIVTKFVYVVVGLAALFVTYTKFVAK